MLSLANAFTEDDLINFEKINNYLSKPDNIKFLIQLNLRLMEFLLH